MKKVYQFIKDIALVYFLLSILLLFVAIFLRRRLGFDITFYRSFRGLFFISFIIAGSVAFFKLDKIPTYLRIILGYFFLFITTLIIRDLVGMRLFRTYFVLMMFFVFCTIIYFLFLFLLVVKNKHEQKEMNDALNDINKKE